MWEVREDSQAPILSELKIRNHIFTEMEEMREEVSCHSDGNSRDVGFFFLCIYVFSCSIMNNYKLDTQEIKEWKKLNEVIPAHLIV